MFLMRIGATATDRDVLAHLQRLSLKTVANHMPRPANVSQLPDADSANSTPIVPCNPPGHRVTDVHLARPVNVAT